MSSPQTIPNQAERDSSHRAVAPAWHTVVVLFVLLGFSFAGRHGHFTSVRVPHSRAAAYILVMIVEWLIVAFIWYGVNRRGVRMAELVGGNWPGPIAFLRDFGIAVGFVLIFGGLVLSGLAHLLKAVPSPAMRAIMPQSRSDLILWVVLSLTAGFCEEVIQRGYLQRQFAAMTDSTLAGIVLQGIVFGLGHGYQGWKLMVPIGIYGILFGWLAYWRRSLRPGMIGHFLQDAAGGFIARYLPH